jgi:catechol 2,3-dioxygenase
VTIDRRVDIGHVHLKVSDLERSLGFYRDVLDFEVMQRWDGSAAFLSAGGYHHHIGLNTWESRGGSPPPAGATGLFHHAIRYPDRAALAAVLRRLVEAGVPLTGASDHGASEALYLRDPDGIGVELYRDRPAEEWPRAPDGTLLPLSDPLDVETLLAEAPGPNGRPIDSRIQIGHVHLKVADLERSLGFYRDVLGFDLTGRLGEEAAFLSAGGYHHHIGLNTWESRGGSPPPPGTTGLFHAAIRYPDRAQLADALGRLVEARIPVDGATDHGVSEAIYLRDPDGNGVELYRDRREEDWPRPAQGRGVAMYNAPFDLRALLAERA